MMLTEVTGVANAALPVEAFKAHLRMGSGFGTESLQDEVLVSFLRAALAAVEARIGKALLRRVYSWVVTSWRDAQKQVFPVAPVHLVSRVVSVDDDGHETVIAPVLYWLERDMHQPMLRAAAAALPAVPQRGSIVVTFEAGLGETWADIPADLHHAVFLLAAHYYEYRHETTLTDGCMPFGVTSLIERYRPLRVGFGARG